MKLHVPWVQQSELLTMVKLSPLGRTSSRLSE